MDRRRDGICSWTLNHRQSAAIDLIRSVPAAVIEWRQEALEGGLPPAALAASHTDRQLWLEGYVETYLQRDLRDLTQVGDLAAFARLMRLAALRTGGLVNQADLARDAAVSRATAARWLSLLEASFIITLLPAFAVSKAKRLIKTPKLYPLDTGLALHLAGVSSAPELERAGIGWALEVERFGLRTRARWMSSALNTVPRPHSGLFSMGAVRWSY